MSEQLFIFTAVPAGITVPDVDGDPRLRLSLHVAPRLLPDGERGGSLATFPDLLDWPQRLRAGGYTVVFQGGTVLRGERVSPEPELTLWRGLFDADTPVRSFDAQSWARRPIRSFPAGHVARFVRERYADIALAVADGTATRGELRAALDPIAPLERARKRAGIEALLEDPALRSVPPGPADATGDFEQLARFFERPTGTPPPSSDLPHDAEFHALLSELAGYPTLLRRLGLVVDVEVPLDPQIPTGLRSSAVRIVPVWPSSEAVPTRSVEPFVAYQLDPSDDRFEARAAAAAPEVVDGLLDLSPEADGPDKLIPFDADDAALRLLALARRLQAPEAGAFADDEDPTGLPALAAPGIVLARSGRAHRTALRLSDVARRERRMLQGQVSPPQRFAEDLRQGYHIDVWDGGTARWYPLCARSVTWSVGREDPGGDGGTFDDEGIVALTLTADGPAPPSDLYAHEALARWTGWSLVAAPPGRASGPDGAPVEDAPGMAGDGPLTIAVRVPPGTLPRLRYGRDYRFRARAVDVAGNARPFGDATEVPTDTASAEVTYRRFDPVPPPSLAAASQPDPELGESVRRLVIRSTPDATAAEFALQRGIAPLDACHVVPPRAPLGIVERCGVLDGPSGLDPTAWGLIADRDGTLSDVEGAQSVGGSGEIFIPSDTFELPYLPDPMAVGAALHGLPGTADGDPLVVYFPGRWPDLAPFRIVIREDLSAGEDGATPPAWNPATGALTVYLRKGDSADVRISAVLDGDDLERMGAWHWLRAAAGGEAGSDFAERGRRGGLPVLTPSVMLTLTHAVDRPLQQPALVDLTATRTAAGQTAVQLAGVARFHGASTAQIALTAHWRELVDDPAAQRPHWRDVGAPVAERQVEASDAELDLASADVVHELGDPRHRRIAYQAVAAARYRREFPNVDAPLDPFEASPLAARSSRVAVDVPSTARPPAPSVAYVVPTFRWQEQPAARRRLGGLRIFLERPWGVSGDAEQLAVVLPDEDLGELPGLDVRLPYLTEWGGHPLRTGAPDSVFPSMQVGGGSGPSRGDIRLAELARPDGSYPADREVRVVPFDVGWDEVRRLWFVDVDIDWGEHAATALIRLALVRYQRHAVPGVEVSPVTRTAFVPVTPERTVSLTDQGAGDWTVAVSCRPAAVPPAAERPGSEFVARLEERPDDPDVVLPDWTTTAEFDLSAASGDPAVFRGGFSAPDEPGTLRRLVVWEREVPGGTGGDADGRVIYADTLTMPWSGRPTPSPGPTATSEPEPTTAATPTPPWTPAPSRTPAPMPDTPTPEPTDEPTPLPTTATPSDDPTGTPSPPVGPGPSDTPTPDGTLGPSQTPGSDDDTATPTDPDGTPDPERRVYFPFTTKDR